MRVEFRKMSDAAIDSDEQEVIFKLLIFTFKCIFDAVKIFYLPYKIKLQILLSTSSITATLEL